MFAATMSGEVFFWSYTGPQSDRIRHEKTSELPDSPRLQVELEGVEPSSKRGINELSTCVVSAWFSSGGRSETANHRLIP